ncbi:FHA domain-containing protein [Cellulomonas wangsupingiae]|uniref:FHA domain-containing protein n=1 Tax=Cellulomonas wangsupingiae TaxID=2968085 RepID=A0ABY5K010_9CELL|nr:FHA domain-containing protein [Cellulomonas wangsupingiae]MCC2336629.1 FHA domain-containing protein [Cellulomonas wangsupingiae]UUI63781.1 FHA domain-containing protein [Cellulomonas wangsupingiae]
MTERDHHEYQHGPWTAVAGGGFLALVEPDASRRVVDGLWDVARDGGDVLAALGVVAADGFAALPRFAVVRADADGVVHAVLRGPVRLRLHGGADAQDVVAGDGAVWTEHRALGVKGLELAVDEDAGSTWWPFVGGVVRAAGLRTRDTTEVTVAPGAVTHEQPVVPEPPHPPQQEAVLPAAIPVVAPEPAVEPEAAAEPVVVTEPEPVASVEPWPVADAEPEPPMAEPEPVGATLAQHATVPDAEPEAVPDIPWWPLAAPAADEPGGSGPLPSAAPVATVDALSAEPGADDHDGMTILSSDLARLRDRLPAWSQDAVPGPFPTPEATPLPARLVLSTGLVVALDRAVLLGRAPQVARVTNRELPRLVTVPSPNQDISRTHAEVRVEGEHVVVTDLDSTNGVHVSRPGEGVRRLHPGEPSVVGTDEVVDLGDGVTFTVERSA